MTEHTVPDEPLAAVPSPPISLLEPPAPLGRVLLGVGGFLAFTLAMHVVNASPPPLPPLVWAFLPPLTAVGYLLLLVGAIRLLCSLQVSPRWEGALTVGGLLAFLGLNPSVWQVVHQLQAGTPLLQALGNVSIAPGGHPGLATLLPALLILTGTCAGRLLARLIRERALLVPVLLIAALIDLWGVYWGPVSQATESAGGAVATMASAATATAHVPEKVQAALPESLAAMGNITPPDQIGFGDFLFLAFFLTCAYRLGFSAHRTAIGLITGLLLATLLMAADGLSIASVDLQIDYLPGLVFICGGVLLANWRAWTLTRQEWLMTGVMVALLATGLTVSAVRAELAKPRESTRTLLLPDCSEAQVTATALAAVAQKRTTGERLVLEGYFLYGTSPAGPALQAWRLLLLERQARVTLRSSWAILLDGMHTAQSPTRWVVSEHAQNPPAEVLHFLGAAEGRESLTRLQTARGIPNAAFTRVPAWSREAARAKHPAPFLLHLTPAGAELLGPKRQVVRTWAY
jgi:hypothetical protein